MLLVQETHLKLNWFLVSLFKYYFLSYKIFQASCTFLGAMLPSVCSGDGRLEPSCEFTKPRTAVLAS